MSAAACALWTLGLACAPGQTYEEAMASLSQGAYGRAWELAGAVEPEVDRARARTAILSAAGDLPGALAEARRGLERFPQQPELLWYATSCALSLRDAAGARRHLEAFGEALASGAVAAQHLEAWERARSGFVPRVEELERVEAARERALAAARATSLALLGLVTAGFAGIAMGRPGSASRTGPSVRA